MMKSHGAFVLALVLLLSLTESVHAQSIGFSVGGGSSEYFVSFRQGEIEVVPVVRSDSAYYLDDGDQYARFLLSMIAPVGVLMGLGILWLILLVFIVRGVVRSFRGAKVDACK